MPSGSSQVSRTQLLMIRAGYRSADAMLAMRGMKIFLPDCAVGRRAPHRRLSLQSDFHYRRRRSSRFSASGHVAHLASARASESPAHGICLTGSILLVICVEVGLGLDQALLRVAQEMRVAHPELSEELQLVNLEMRVGKSRIEALRSLSGEPASRM